MAALHARCFADAPPPWGVAAFAETLASAGVFLCTAGGGFALGRVAGPEAELLTIAVAPEARRRGTGRALLAAFEAEARARGAAEAFLEVAETNAAGRGLYAGGGYAVAGRRPGYYAKGSAAALVMRKDLPAENKKPIDRL